MNAVVGADDITDADSGAGADADAGDGADTDVVS